MLRATGRRLTLSSSSLNGGSAFGCRLPLPPPPTRPSWEEKLMGRSSRLFSATARLMSTPVPADAVTTLAAFEKLRSSNVSPAAPWLVLPPQAFERQEVTGGGGVVDDRYCMGLLDLASSSCVPVSVPMPVAREGQEVSSWSWIGSSHGWLILGDPNTNSLWLFNPFYYTYANALRHDPSFSNSSIFISLPNPITDGSLPPKLPNRVFLSSPPPSHSQSQSSSAQYPPRDDDVVDRTCKLFALYDKAIAFCIIKADSTPSAPLEWKLLRLAPTNLAHFRDAFFDGRWLVSMSSFSSDDDQETIVRGWEFGDLPTSDPSAPDVCRYIIQQHMDISEATLRYEKLCRPKAYISVWAPRGKLDEDFRSLIVMRYVAPHFTENEDDDDEERRQNGLGHKTLAFEVHSFNPARKGLDRVDSLGNQALFLGDNQCFALPITGEGGPFKSNCIYFTDDYGGHSSFGVGHDCGVFDMADQTIRPLHRFDFGNLHPHPIWILPSLPVATTSSS